MSFLLTHTLACYAGGMLGAIATLVTKRQGFFTAAVGAMMLGFGFHTADLAIDIWRDGHLPLYGAQEVCSFLGWALVRVCGCPGILPGSRGQPRAKRPT